MITFHLRRFRLYDSAVSLYTTFFHDVNGALRNELTFYMVRDKIKTFYGKSWKFTGLNHFSTSKEFPNENTRPKLI